MRVRIRVDFSRRTQAMSENGGSGDLRNDRQKRPVLWRLRLLLSASRCLESLHELLRVLRPGERFHFLEHGLCPELATSRWQHRLNGFQRRVAGGCNLNRPIDRLIQDAGFDIRELRNDWFRGPPPSKPWGYLYEGVAARPDG